MITYQNYLLAKTPAEALEAAGKRGTVVLGGTGWLKMETRAFGAAVDLSALGLDTIERTESGFAVGAMATLRTLETDTALNEAFGGIFAACVRGIVGVQFRNCATVGGSIWSRFGFSDVLTAFLVTGAEVELAGAGRMPLAQFAAKGAAGDVLLRIHVPAPGENTHFAYECLRAAATDLPVLNVAVCRAGRSVTAAVGGRPLRAEVRSIGLPAAPKAADLEKAAEELAGRYTYGSNMRGSAAYRAHLARVLLARTLEKTAEE